MLKKLSNAQIRMSWTMKIVGRYLILNSTPAKLCPRTKKWLYFEFQRRLDSRLLSDILDSRDRRWTGTYQLHFRANIFFSWCCSLTNVW